MNTLDALGFWAKIVQRGLRELPYDLSSRQMGVMLSVYLTPPPHTIRNLSERLGVSKPAICRAVDALSAVDLIRRKKDDDDRRNVLIQRTVTGSVFLSDFADIIMQENDGAAFLAKAEDAKTAA